jgi:hypothetical protein
MRLRAPVSGRLSGVVILVMTLSIAVAASSIAGFTHGTQTASQQTPRFTLNAPPFQIVSFGYSPSSVTVGSQVQGNVQLSGGTAPYYAWLNGTPPGCNPQSSPYTTNNTSNPFNCTPTAQGNYNVHLDVVDSSIPSNHQTRTATLTVNSNSSGNNGGNGSGSGGFSLPSGLFTTLILFGVVFLSAIVALAAGVIASAVMVSRRLRQLNETLGQQRKEQGGFKPPT